MSYDLEDRLVTSAIITLVFMIGMVVVFFIIKKKETYLKTNKIKDLLGQIYVRNALMCFVPGILFCETLYEFLVLQFCLILAALTNAQYINKMFNDEQTNK
ncbi:hypothetical protein [Clostridium sp. DL1XJH146]